MWTSLVPMFSWTHRSRAEETGEEKIAHLTGNEQALGK